MALLLPVLREQRFTGHGANVFNCVRSMGDQSFLDVTVTHFQMMTGSQSQSMLNRTRSCKDHNRSHKPAGLGTPSQRYLEGILPHRAAVNMEAYFRQRDGKRKILKVIIMTNFLKIIP